jgi:hypothetical protein
MASASIPVAGDVVLSLTHCALLPQCYEIGIVPGPAQLCVIGREDALACAIAYADSRKVDVWLVAAPEKPVRVTHARAAAIRAERRVVIPWRPAHGAAGSPATPSGSRSRERRAASRSAGATVLKHKPHDTAPR